MFHQPEEIVTISHILQRKNTYSYITVNSCHIVDLSEVVFYVPFKHHPTIGDISSPTDIWRWCSKSLKRDIWRFPKMGGTPKSSILMGLSSINQPFGNPPWLWKAPFPNLCLFWRKEEWKSRFTSRAEQLKKSPVHPRSHPCIGQHGQPQNGSNVVWISWLCIFIATF